jgi:hypothetical protein
MTQALGSIKTINKNKQQKQRSRHDAWNTRHARDIRSTHNAAESTSSDRDTVPRQQDYHVILVDFLK